MREGSSKSSEQPQGGLDLKGLARTFGPMAAVAAGIILARGAGARQIGEMLKKVAPKHFEGMNRSPFPYFISTEKSEAGPTFRLLKNTLRNQLDPEAGPSFEAARKYFGSNQPQHIGVLNIPENYPGALGATHEFGHGAGFERVRSQYPNANPFTVFRAGGTHLDILGKPETKEIIKSGLKDPDLREYLQGRLATNYPGEPLHHPLGEYLNELWARRMVKRSGVDPGESITKHPSWAYSRSQIEKKKPALDTLTDYIAQKGELTPIGMLDQNMALRTLLNQLKESQVQFRPAQPSPTQPW